MYKRRKVFSKIGEKTFSTTEFQTQKEFAAKKKSTEKIDGESKKEKVAKAATIGGATVGLGAGAAGLGAEIGRKKVKKATNQLEMEKANILDKAKKATAGGKTIPALTKNQEADLEIKKAAQKKLQKIDKVLEKVSKKAGKAGIAGVGASVAGAVAYKALKKKKDQKEFAEKKEDKKNKAEKIGNTIENAGIVGAASAITPGVAAGLHPQKELLKATPGFTKTYIKSRLGKNITAKDSKKVDKAIDAAIKTLNSAAVNNPEKYIRRAGKVVEKKIIKNAKIGLGVAATGAGLKTAGKIVRKNKEKKEEKKNK